MSKPRTICANCKWCNIHQELTDVTNRLEYRCTAVLHDKAIDPVTGKTTFLTHEAKFLTDYRHPNCIDMNPNGECAMYEDDDA